MAGCDVSKSWLGCSLDEIYCHHGPWAFETEEISASRHHAVLYELPAKLTAPPRPHVNSQIHHGNSDYVQMPFSPKSLHPEKNDNNEETWKPRWELIQLALLRPINSSRELEEAINKYNTRLPKFEALHQFFDNLEEEEAGHFFKYLLPRIIQLALQLPDILPGNLPLLKKESNKAISISQYQISSLLANGFLCTFPYNKNKTCSGVNFIRLFSAYSRPNRIESVHEKLKCICHYFRRVTSTKPIGVVTFERKYIAHQHLPRWDRRDNTLSGTKIHVSSTGVIEDDGIGLLQVDFANKNIGGGVLAFGCVQEEIRFVICPELLVSRLVTEELGSTEALVITGVERYSEYKGYGNTFTWSGNHDDQTPHDTSGRRRTSIVAIDALRFTQPTNQFHSSLILRELNKAYVGFHSKFDKKLPAVATGNWGCGAFRGDPSLKFLIQFMACCASKRDMVYFTFEDVDLKDRIYNIYEFLSTNRITICQLWRYLCQFSQAKLKSEQLYSYIQQAHFDNKGFISVKDFFQLNKQKCDNSFPSTSTSKNSPLKKPIPKPVSSNELSPDLFDDDFDATLSDIIVPEDDVVESSQKDAMQPKSLSQLNFEKFKKKPRPKQNFPSEEKHNEIIRLLDIIDEKPNSEEVKSDGSYSLLSSIDEFAKKMKREEDKCEPMLVDDAIIDIDSDTTSEVSEQRTKLSTKRKITDYFIKTTPDKS